MSCVQEQKHKCLFNIFKFCNSFKTAKFNIYICAHLHELNNIIKDEVTMYHLEVEFNNETGNLVYNRKLKEGSGKAVLD